MYAGEWLDDKREGFGEYFYTNGDHYTGEWRNHVRHGRGRYTYASAAIQYDGNWNNGFRTDDDDRHLEQHQTDAVGAVVSSAAETGPSLEIFTLYIQETCFYIEF